MNNQEVPAKIFVIIYRNIVQDAFITKRGYHERSRQGRGCHDYRLQSKAATV